MYSKQENLGAKSLETSSPLAQSSIVHEALYYLTRAINLAPNNRILLTQRGELYKACGMPNEAIFDFFHSLRIFPACVETLTSLAQILHEYYGQCTLALHYYNTALRLDGNYSRAIAGRGLVYFQMGDFNSALIDFDLALSKGVHNTEILSIRGFLNYNNHKLDDALNDLNAAIALVPDNPLALTNRAMCYNRMGQFRLALADAIKASYLSPITHSALAVIIPNLSRLLQAAIHETQNARVQLEFLKIKLDLARSPLGDQSLIEPLKEVIDLLQTAIENSPLVPKVARVAPPLSEKPSSKKKESKSESIAIEALGSLKRGSLPTNVPFFKPSTDEESSKKRRTQSTANPPQPNS